MGGRGTILVKNNDIESADRSLLCNELRMGHLADIEANCQTLFQKTASRLRHECETGNTATVCIYNPADVQRP
jgi:hypothetical protein